MGLTGHTGVLNQELLVIILIYTSTCLSQKTTKTVVITADEEKLRDPDGYAAIVELHKQMDVDESGDIDRAESKGFIGMNDMLGGSDRAKREMAFHHGNDDKVDVDELWEAWFASNVRSWSTSELVSWLQHAVKLPQYSDAILSNRLDGRSLPRMALLNSSFLTDTLGVKSLKDKKKIVIKALDLVLFGMAEDGASKAKDIALSVLAVLLVTVLVVLKKQLRRSRSEMEQLSKKLAQLKTMESDFEIAQKKFEEEQKRRQSISDANALETEQVATLRSQLIEAERLLESNNSAPLALQPLLRRTCELEMSYIGQQRLECIAEMSEAIELIEKLRKKQSGIISSIKLATGASVGTDQVDSRIFSLKARMEKISITMAECQRRWVEIESLCGFPIVLQGGGTEISFMAPATSVVSLPHPSSSSQFTRASAPIAASICSSSSTESKAFTGSVGSLISSSSKTIPRAIASPTSYPSRQTANGTVITGHRQTPYQMHSASSDDLHLRSLAMQRHQRQTAASTTPSESYTLPFQSPLQRQFEAESMESEEVNSRQSNSSICSTSSNDDEKENGTSDKKSCARPIPKKMKFHLFRKAKYSA